MLTSMGPLHLSDHVVQNHQTGEQMTHWDMWNKKKKFKFGGFVYHVPVRHLLTSKAVLHHEVGQLQRAHSLYIFAMSRFKSSNFTILLVFLAFKI